MTKQYCSLVGAYKVFSTINTIVGGHAWRSLNTLLLISRLRNSCARYLRCAAREPLLGRGLGCYCIRLQCTSTGSLL